MPKKVKKYEEEEEDDEDEEEEEFDDDELEREEVAKQKIQVKRKPGRPKVIQPGTPQTPQEVKKRYIGFAQPARIGVADAETGEVVGEGETAVFDILADILERLERIENTQGNMLE